MAKRPAKKPTTFCKQSHTPETKEERRKRLASRRIAQEFRMSHIVIVTTKQHAAERREAERVHRSLVSTALPGVSVPPVSYPKNRLVVSKHVPAGPGKNVTEKRENLRRFLKGGTLPRFFDALEQSAA